MNIKISASNVNVNFYDMLCALSNDGSKYWSSVERIETYEPSVEEINEMWNATGNKRWVNDPEVWMVEKLAYDLETGKSIKVNDEERGKTFIVSKKNFQKGYTMMFNEYPEVFNRLATPGEWDIYDMDMLFQAAALGKVVYG